MTVPFSHDDLFDDLRANGLGPAPADVTAVGRPRPKATARELLRQTARGLAQVGVETAFTPYTIAETLAGQPTGGLPSILSTLFLRAGGEKLGELRREELGQLDTFYGLPETGGGRGANIAGQVIGTLALLGLGGGKPKPPRGPTTAERLSPIPGSGGRGFEVTGPRAMPPVPSTPTLLEIQEGKFFPLRVPSEGTVQRAEAAANDALERAAREAAEAMRRAPPGSKERRLLEDMLGVPIEERQSFPGGQTTHRGPPDRRTGSGREHVKESPEEYRLRTNRGPEFRAVEHTPPDIRTLEELMNRTAFGKPRGPFVHPERRVPIIGARTSDEPLVLAPTGRRAREIRDMEDALNAAFRDAILENQRAEAPVTGIIRLRRPRSLFNFGLKVSKQ